jgi:hypothetical protein
VDGIAHGIVEGIGAEVEGSGENRTGCAHHDALSYRQQHKSSVAAPPRAQARLFTARDRRTHQESLT